MASVVRLKLPSFGGHLMSKWHGGKGSRQRPTDKDKFNEQFDKIFGTRVKPKKRSPKCKPKPTKQ